MFDQNVDFLIVLLLGLVLETEIMKTWNIREYHKTLLRQDMENIIRAYRAEVLKDEPVQVIA